MQAMLEEAPLTRWQLGRRVLLAACGFSAIALLLGGVPPLGAIILAPIALLRSLLIGGFCTILFAVAIILRIATVAEKGDHFWTSFHQSLTAAIIGLGPHALFLLLLNHTTISTPSSAIAHTAGWYERNVQALQDCIGGYLLLPLGAGVAACVTVFVIRTGNPVAARWVTRTLEGCRLAGLTLVAATTFTVLSAAPAEGWHPNTRSEFTARWKDYVAVSAELSVIQSINTSLSNPTSSLRTDLGSFVGRIRNIAPDDIRQTATKTYERLKASRNQPTWQQQRAAEAQRAPSIDRDALQQLVDDSRTVHSKAVAAREMMSSLVGTLSGYAGEAFVGAFLSAFVEDAASRLANDFLENDRTLETLTPKLNDLKERLVLFQQRITLASAPLLDTFRNRIEVTNSENDAITARIAAEVSRERQRIAIESMRKRSRPHPR
ncbi:hypothetical protein [Rhizobium rhizogenes]|uniref:hypothetical protein n=1 Tax=Rhizobium rhizogenes TaxID=359 RepID=UPI0024BE7649|nr:hypothetical protein [Rhizobium rhizogenes]MDJ1638188.1 hypothetical protein [Rhizobium rhizogenes]